MQQINLKIYGMSCVGCTNMVKMLLQKYPGVRKTDVNLMPPEAIILCENDIIPYDLIKYLENNSKYKALVNIKKIK